jgi:hypothetical protein
LQRDIDAQIVANRYVDAGLNIGLEAIGFHLQGIGADRQAGENIDAG